MSVNQNVNDSAKVSVAKKEAQIKDLVKYLAKDSLRFDMEMRKVFLYGGAELQYEDINLKANYVEIDFKTNKVFATYTLDSAGNETGVPVFKQGNEEFKAKKLTYDIKTKKGIIKEIFTEQSGGYLHGSQVKKLPDNSILIKSGSFSTCELEHPHFEIHFDKAKVIPNDKIITGPAYLMVEGVPTVLAVPFGFFPNQKTQKSGVLIPMVGNSANLGYALDNGGYFLAFGDYANLAIRGSLYTRGSWKVNTSSTYIKRYKYNGSLGVDYSNIKLGDKGFPDYQVNKAFKIRWKHNQDPKARPRSRFSANVNAGSSSFNRYNSYNPNDYLANEMSSSISYNTSIGSKANLSINARSNQNTTNKMVNVSLPEIAFNISRLYPFKNLGDPGKKRFYKEIGLSYSMNARNQVQTYDSLFALPEIMKRLNNGVKHTIPVSASFKVLKYLTFTPSANYNMYWYTQSIRKNWNPLLKTIDVDTLNGFVYGQDFYGSASLTTKLYGFLKFKKGKIQAVRHVITPSASISYRPDFSTPGWGYYKSVQSDTLMNTVKYSVFSTGLFGGPPVNESGILNLALSNNVEMKIRTPRDTANPVKKVVLIDNLTIGTNYDLAKDTLRWSKVIVSGRTKLFKRLDITYSSILDPYIIDSNDRNLNQFEWKVNNRMFRLSQTDWNFSLNLDLSPKKKNVAQKPGPKSPEGDLNDLQRYPGEYVDFNMPWRLNVFYTMRYSKTKRYTGPESQYLQSLSFNGDISITPKWKIGMTSGYDFKAKDFSYTSIDIYRDLHCWEMRFNWIPFGFHKSYFFTLNVKASMLQDLKLTKKRTWWDR